MINFNTHSQRGRWKQGRGLVGYGFSLPSKSSSFNQRIFYLFKFLFVGRLKPYPTEFYDINSGEKGRSPVGRGEDTPTYKYFNVYPFGFDYRIGFCTNLY